MNRLIRRQSLSSSDYAVANCNEIICALMKVKLSVTVRNGYRIQNVESIDQIVNAIKHNPFYFFDIKITDMSSTLFPVEHSSDDITNPFFE